MQGWTIHLHPDPRDLSGSATELLQFQPFLSFKSLAFNHLVSKIINIRTTAGCGTCRHQCLFRIIIIIIRSVVSLAPSAFLASAVSSRSLQNEIIPTLSAEPDTDFDMPFALVWVDFSSTSRRPSGCEATFLGWICCWGVEASPRFDVPV